MSIKAGVGKSDLEALRKSGNYYVDKTDNQVSLLTRPWRFGKTLMISEM